MNFVFKNDELCIANDELCLTIDEFCIENDEFSRPGSRRTPKQRSSKGGEKTSSQKCLHL